MSHYYRQDGSPAHFEAKGGKPTTLREARKLDLYPSVTTVGQVRAKPPLITWLQRQAAFEAWEWTQNNTPPECFSPNDDWANALIASAREKTFAKADDGSDIHAVLEVYFGGGEAHEECVRVFGDDAPLALKLCQRVEAVIADNCGAREWVAEASFCNTELGYAGKCDLHSPARLAPWVLDFKSKDGSVQGVRGYQDQDEQLAAYAYGFGIPNARRANVFISRDRDLWGTDEGVSFFEHTDDNAWNRFYHTLLLWQVCNKFGPLYERSLEAAA